MKAAPARLIPVGSASNRLPGPMNLMRIRTLPGLIHGFAWRRVSTICDSGWVRLRRLTHPLSQVVLTLVVLFAFVISAMRKPIPLRRQW